MVVAVSSCARSGKHADGARSRDCKCRERRGTSSATDGRCHSDRCCGKVRMTHTATRLRRRSLVWRESRMAKVEPVHEIDGCGLASAAWPRSGGVAKRCRVNRLCGAVVAGGALIQRREQAQCCRARARWWFIDYCVQPNPALERTATGKALEPRGVVAHHPPRGPSALPASAAQLKR